MCVFIKNVEKHASNARVNILGPEYEINYELLTNVFSASLVPSRPSFFVFFFACRKKKRYCKQKKSWDGWV